MEVIATYNGYLAQQKVFSKENDEIGNHIITIKMGGDTVGDEGQYMCLDEVKVYR